MTEAVQLVLLAGAIGFAGGALSTLVTLLIARGTRKSEDRRHFIELVVKAGVENWKITSETTTKRVVLPMDMYILYMARFCELCFRDDIDAASFDKKLAEVETWMHKVMERRKLFEPYR